MATLPETGERVYLDSERAISNREIVAARAVPNPLRADGTYQLKLQLRRQAARRLVAGHKAPNRLGVAVLLNGKLVKLLTLHGDQYEHCAINGLTREQAELLATALSRGPGSANPSPSSPARRAYATGFCEGDFGAPPERGPST